MTRKNLFLGGVFGLLLALAFLYSGPFQKWREELLGVDNFLAGVDIGQINAINISSADGELSISKDEKGWLIDGTKDFYLTEERADKLNSELAAAIKADLELASENAEKKALFETDSESGYSIKLKNSADTLKEFVVGKNGDNFSSSYISEKGSDSTYLIASNLSAAFGHNDWYNKIVFASEADKINKIRFQYPSREFTVEKQGDEEATWSGVLPYRFSVDDTKLDKVLKIMSELKAVDIPEQSFAGTGLEKNNIIIQASGEGVDSVLMVGDADKDGNFYAKRGDSDNIYLISATDRNELEKRIRDLR